MKRQPRFRSIMLQAPLAEAELPAWLMRCIHAFDAAALEVQPLPVRQQAEYLPILVGSDAVISAHVDRLIRERKPAPDIDKMKMLKLKAKAVEMLLKPAWTVQT